MAIGTAPANEPIVMLGHGTSNGLFSPYGDNQFARMIVSSKLVDLLREHTCIGVWCYANEFAKQYGLKGLFTGMIISEYEEALDNCIDIGGEDLELNNNQFASDLEYCMRKYSLDLIPDKMKVLQDYHSPLKDFNYSNIFYLK